MHSIDPFLSQFVYLFYSQFTKFSFYLNLRRESILKTEWGALRQSHQWPLGLLGSLTSDTLQITTGNWRGSSGAIKQNSYTTRFHQGFPRSWIRALYGMATRSGNSTTGHTSWLQATWKKLTTRFNPSNVGSFQYTSTTMQLTNLPHIALNKPLGFITQETFPLPNLHPKLRSISQEIHTGHGFKVIRGVPVTKYTREENVIIYAGIAAHVAPTRGRQDHEHEGKAADVVLAHIKDLSQSEDASRIGAPAYTADKQVFHTDAGDVIALFALGEAAQGGESYLSSSWRVYNELAATRPDLVRTLAEPWAADEYAVPSFLPISLLCVRPSR